MKFSANFKCSIPNSYMHTHTCNRLKKHRKNKITVCTYGSSASLSVSLSAPLLSVGGLSLDGGGHDGDPRSGSAGPARPSLTRATPQRGSEI